MPGKTPHSNGKEPIENGVRNNNKDVEMTDEKSSAKGKGKKNVKEGEDMTVVVPTSKATKQSSHPLPDSEGDIAMGDSDKAEELEVKVDPVTQTIAGTSLAISIYP